MKILLILPADKDWRVTEEGRKGAPRSMLRFGVLGLEIIAGLTPEEHDVKIIDENVQYLDMDQEADVVGISFMTGLAPRAYEIAARFEKRGAITVAGGYHPTLNPEEAAKYFDIVVAGQAEGIWQRVLTDIAQCAYESIYYTNPCQPPEYIPHPRRDLLKDDDSYSTIWGIQTGRGCNHKCKFCSITAFFEGNFYNRPMEDVLEEIKETPKHFMFVDDNIIGNPEYAKKLFTAMIPLKKRWISQCDINLAEDDELLELAYKAGCRGVFVGVESISEENLAEMDKEFNDAGKLYEKIRKIKKAGIGVQAGMIVGLDKDDVTVFEKSLRFLQKSGIGALQLAILTPQPGTPLHTEFKRDNRLLHTDWSQYDYRNCVIKPNLMTPKELQAGANWLYLQYYRLDRILLRTLRLAFTDGLSAALLSYKLGITYRYSLIREGRIGWNPARATKPRRRFFFHRLQAVEG